MKNPISLSKTVSGATDKKQSGSWSDRLLVFVRSGYLIALYFILFVACNLNEGKRTYEQACSNCHMNQGQGLEKLIPGFKSESFQSDRTKMICKIIHGVNDSMNGDFMPSYEFMDDAQVANILNYIARLKDFKARPFTDKDVLEARKRCE